MSARNAIAIPLLGFTSLISKRYLQSLVDCSIIQNNQEMEIIQMSIGG